MKAENTQTKPETNLDRIRNMSLKETAQSRIEWIKSDDQEPEAYMGDFGKCYIAPPYSKDECERAYINALAAEMKWLLEPAEKKSSSA